MRSAPETLPAQLSVHDAVERMQSSQFRAWLVEDDGSIVGVLSKGTIEHALTEGRAEQKLLSLFESLDFPHVHPDHPLHLALERMSKAHIDILPVVNRADIHILEGVITLHDVLDSYGVDSTGSA
jgi:predicted transcriptional regulator